MTHYPVTKEQLEQALTHRINQAQAELRALKAVTINTKHKALTNRTITTDGIDGVSARIGDYSSLGKALYVYYQFRKDGVYLSNEMTDITAYTYQNPDGTEIGSEGGLRTSRTMTPIELKTVLDGVIAGREVGLNNLKADLVNAKAIVSTYNTLAKQMNELLDSTTWATRAVLK